MSEWVPAGSSRLSPEALKEGKATSVRHQENLLTPLKDQVEVLEAEKQASVQGNGKIFSRIFFRPNLNPRHFLCLLVFFLAVAVRLVHNAAMMSSPLYFVPLGWHRVFLDTALQIFQGDLFPGDRPFTENSPLLPYLFAFQHLLFGGENLFFMRLVGLTVDSVTAALLVVLGIRFFALLPGFLAGLLYALYAPAVFYAVELIYIPYTLFFLVAAVLLLTVETRRAGAAAGCLLGFATLTMPTVFVIALLCCTAPLVTKGSNFRIRALSAVVTLFLAISPVTLLNYFRTGSFVLLTTTAGTNFYIGHNPFAQAGYVLPDVIGPVQFVGRGSIFDKMKQVAEEVERRTFRDTEVSPYYFRKALGYIMNHPWAELKLALLRLAALLNSYEATTYADYYYQREVSPVLRSLVPFELLLAFAVVGLFGAAVRKVYLLLIPLAGTVIIMLLFFYLSRLRMPLIPFLCVFAGCGAALLSSFLKEREWAKVFALLSIFTATFFFARIPWVSHSSSNEWNKVGIVLLWQEKLEEANKAFERARQENPQDPNTYFNLARLAEKRSQLALAAALREQARALLTSGSREYYKALRSQQ